MAVALIAAGRASSARDLIEGTVRLFVVDVACPNPAFIYGTLTREGLNDEGNIDLLPPAGVELLLGALRQELRGPEQILLRAEGGVCFRCEEDVQLRMPPDRLRRLLGHCLALATLLQSPRSPGPGRKSAR